MNLRDEVQAYLERTGETRAALAQKISVYPSTITRLLSGKTQDMKGRNLKKLEAVLAEGQHE